MPVVTADNVDLLRMDQALQNLFLESGYIQAASVKTLADAGVDKADLFYLLGDPDSPNTSQLNLGRSGVFLSLHRSDRHLSFSL